MGLTKIIRDQIKSLGIVGDLIVEASQIEPV